MKVVNDKTTRKDNNKNQTTNIIYDQNSISVINKIVTKSNSDQIKSKRNNLTYTSLDKIWNLSSMRLVNRSTKRAKRCEVQKHVSYFEKNYFTEIPKMFDYISIGSN